MILARTDDELSHGLARDWHTHTDRHTDAGNDKIRSSKMALGKNEYMPVILVALYVRLIWWQDKPAFSLLYIYMCIVRPKLCTHCRRVFYQHWLTLIPAWTSNRIPSKVRGQITYSFPYLNSAAFEVWEPISNFESHFIMDGIIHPCCAYI